jgi:hypothetical protein
MLFHMFDQYRFQFLAGQIFRVDDPFAGMSAFPSKVEIHGFSAWIRGMVFPKIEPDAQFHQFLNSGGTVFDDQIHDIRVTEAIPGGQGILDVQIKRIKPAENRGNTALGMHGIAFHDIPFGDQGHTAMFSDFQGEHQSCDPASDNQKIRMVLHL